MSTQLAPGLDQNVSKQAEPEQPNRSVLVLEDKPKDQGQQESAQAGQEDIVLLSVWASMVAFDQRAQALKQEFVTRRRQVIYLTLAATCLAAISSTFSVLTGGNSLAVACAITGIIFATFTTFLRDDVSEFSKTTTWISLRHITELIRTQMYLYRMGAGVYRNHNNNEADDILCHQIEKIQAQTVEADSDLLGVSDPTSIGDQRAMLVANGEIKPNVLVLKALSFQQYKQDRMDYQKNWYDQKIATDYKSLKRSSRRSRVILGLGAVLTALGLATTPQFAVLIVISSAFAAAITSDANVNMYGKTYGLFQIAAQSLGNLNREWLAKQNNPEMQNPTQCVEVERDFVENVEKILANEYDTWYSMAQNIQKLNDRAIIAEKTNDTVDAEAK